MITKLLTPNIMVPRTTNLLFKLGVFDGLKFPNSTQTGVINLNAVDSNCCTANGTDNKLSFPSHNMTENSSMELYCKFYNDISNQRYLGIGDTASAFFLIGIHTGKWWGGFGDTLVRAGTADLNWHKHTLNKVGYYVDDVLVYDMSVATFTPTTQIAYILGGASTNYVNVSVASAKYMESGVAINHFVMSQGKGAKVYDVVSGIGYTVAGTVSDATNWNANKQSLYHYNLQYGFDLWQNDTDHLYVRIPLKSDGTSILTSGDTLTGYTFVSKHTQNGNVLLPFEGTYKFDEVASLIASDVGNWAFTEGTANAITYAQITNNIGDNDSIFTRVKTLYKDRMLWYSTAQTGSNLSKIGKYTEQP